MQQTKLDSPVIIVGTTRSGTSMLCWLLGKLPGLAPFYEPNSLWRTGHAYRDHDRATAADARPWVVRHIRHVFRRQQQRNGGARLVEKSPTNVLRVPFVREIFPESPIVHIVRDGRAVLVSQLDKYRSFYSSTIFSRGTRQHLMQRLEQTVWWEWPAYLPRICEGAFRSYVLRRPVKWFGLRYPGWKSDRGQLSLVQCAAKQWAVAVQTALEDLRQTDPALWLHVKYEDVIDEPERWFRVIVDFCGVSVDDNTLRSIARAVHRRSRNRGRELPPDVAEECLPIMEPMVRKLGYLE